MRSRAMVLASATLPATPTTVMSGSRASIADSASARSWWSSTNRTRIGFWSAVTNTPWSRDPPGPRTRPGRRPDGESSTGRNGPRPALRYSAGEGRAARIRVDRRLDRLRATPQPGRLDDLGVEPDRRRTGRRPRRGADRRSRRLAGPGDPGRRPDRDRGPAAGGTRAHRRPR